MNIFTWNTIRRSAIALACVLLGAWPAHAQDSLLPTVRAERAKYGVALSPIQLADLLNAVAWQHRHQGWGLLSKGFGNKCPAPQQVFVACDVLVHLPTAHHFDVLRDAEGTAEPVWRDAGVIELNRFVMPMDPNPGTPIPDPGIPPPVDLSAIMQRLELLDAKLSAWLAAIEQAATRPFPDYRGSVFFWPVVLRPELPEVPK